MHVTPPLPTARLAALALLIAAALLPHGAPARAATASHPTGHVMTPEVRLVDDYSNWYAGGAYAGDMAVLRAGLPRYITDSTVLHEAVSLPWGGTSVGYGGWVHLSEITGPIFGKIASDLEVSDPSYYQRGNIVIREVTVTVKGNQAAPQPFVMGLVEKFTIENGRIKQIDEYFQDTAGFLDRLSALGALPVRRQ